MRHTELFIHSVLLIFIFYIFNPMGRSGSYVKLSDVKIRNRMVNIKSLTQNNKQEDTSEKLENEQIRSFIIQKMETKDRFGLGGYQFEELIQAESQFAGSRSFSKDKLTYTFDSHLKNVIAGRRIHLVNDIIAQSNESESNILAMTYGGIITLMIILSIVFLYQIKRNHSKNVVQKKGEKFYRFLIDDSPFAVILFQQDIIVDCNDKAQVIFGCTIPEIIGSSIHQFFPKIEDEKIYSEEVILDHWIQTADGIPRVFEWKLKRKDGSLIDVYISLNQTEYNGDLFLGAIIQDISEIKNSQRLSRLTKTVIDESAHQVLLLRPDGSICYVNRLACRELGYEEDELRSLHIAEVVPDFSNGKWAQYYPRIKEKKQILMEMSQKGKSGYVYPSEIRTIFVEFEGEEYIAFYANDISERKTVEEALSIREERYRLLIENVPSIVYTANQAGEKIFISSKLSQLYGYTPEEIYENGDELWQKRIHPADVDRVKKEFESLFSENKKYNTEYRIQRKDNQWIWFSDKASVIEEIDGHRYAYGVISDFTEWKESEYALEESEAKFRILTEESPNMIFINRNGKVLFVNNRCFQIVGYTQNEIYAEEFDFLNLFVPDDREKVQSKFKKQKPELDITPDEYTLLNKKNEKIQVIINSKLIEYEGEIAVLGIITDITQRKLAEEIYRESERRFRAIFESAAIGVFTADLGGLFVEVNLELQEMLGYSADELKKINFTEIGYSEDRKGNLLCFQELVSEKRSSYQLEIRHIRKDNKIIWNRLTVSLVYDAGNQPNFLIGILENITQQKLTQIELVKSEETYRLLIENAQEGVTSMDNNGKILLINKSAANFLGGEPKDYFGKYLIDIFPKKIAKGWIESIKQVIKSGEGFDSDNVVTVNNQKHWVQSSTQPIRNKSGKIYAVLSISRDITEQKIAENQLMNSEQNYRTLFESMAQGVIYQDEKGKIFSINKAAKQILGLNQDQIIGQKTIDVHALGVREDGSRFLLSAHPARVALKTGKRVKNTIMGLYNMKENKRVWILLDSVPQFNPDQKKPFQVFTTFTDISENKNSEENIKKSSEQLRVLTKHLQSVREEERKMISREIHDEFGQLLTALKMNLSLISQELLENNKFFHESDHLSNEINMMTKLVDSSLKEVKNIISRLRPEVLDNLEPVAAIKWAVTEFRTRSGINCEFRTTIDNIALNKDRTVALFRILQEALTNVTRHSHATNVKINISMENRNLKLSISDNGVGISMKKIDKSGSFGILGMKERADFLGGKMDILSKKGKGTEIIVCIPIQVEKNEVLTV